MLKPTNSNLANCSLCVYVFVYSSTGSCDIKQGRHFNFYESRVYHVKQLMESNGTGFIGRFETGLRQERNLTFSLRKEGLAGHDALNDQSVDGPGSHQCSRVVTGGHIGGFVIVRLCYRKADSQDWPVS